MVRCVFFVFSSLDHHFRRHSGSILEAIGDPLGHFGVPLATFARIFGRLFAVFVSGLVFSSIFDEFWYDFKSDFASKFSFFSNKLRSAR